jgi:hypothetical protein
MAVIIALVLGALSAAGMLDTQGSTLIEMLFHSWKGVVLAGMLVLFALLYPTISFDTIDMHGDMKEHRDDVVDSFAAYGYALDSENGGVMVFRAKSRLRRLLWQFDDAVTMEQHDGHILISGTKKIVPRVQLRLNAFLNNIDQ